jgi:hypothetical protein
MRAAIDKAERPGQIKEPYREHFKKEEQSQDIQPSKGSLRENEGYARG